MSKKYSKPVAFSYFSLNRHPDDESLHFIARYNGRFVGGKITKRDNNDGYDAGNFKLIRKFWPKLCALIDYFDQLVGVDSLTSGPQKTYRHMEDENFGEVLDKVKEKHEADLQYWLDLFGEQNG